MRIIALVLLLGFGSAQGWVKGILTPPTSQIEEVCKSVYDAFTANLPRPKYSYSAGDVLNFWYRTPLGFISDTCYSTAKKLEPYSLPKAYASLLTVRGKAYGIAEARTWAAVLVLFDESGAELARIKPHKISDVGDLRYWSPDCSRPLCEWTGSNYYYFQIDAPDLAALEKATSFGFLISRGKGIERLVFDSKTYPDLK